LNSSNNSSSSVLTLFIERSDTDNDDDYDLNSLIKFEGEFYKQLNGIAMGSKCGPAIANIYIAYLEKSFLTINIPICYYRFIDDIFVMILDNFHISILTLNWFSDLKLNVVSDSSVNFLDLDISLNEFTNKLNFS
jgi:hypothetical protein